MHRRKRASISARSLLLWAMLASAGLGMGLGASSNTARAQPTTAVNLVDTEDDSSRLPWRGTSLSVSQSLNINSFSQSAQRSYNPTFGWSFIVVPRWYFTKRIYASIDQRLSLELTDSDSARSPQRALLSDSIVGLDGQLYEVPFRRVGSLEFIGGVALIAPTSLASRASTMTLGTRVRLGANMVWEHAMKGLSVAVQGRYGHRFLRHDTVQVEQPYPCLSGGLNAQNCEFLGSTSNQRDAASAIISGSLQMTEQFGLEVLVWLSYARGTNLAPYTWSNGVSTVELPDNSTTRWRNERYLVLGANWTATDWLTVGLSLIDYFPEKGPDGSNRGLLNPLDLMVGLTTSVAFDRLYLATLGQQTKPMRQP